MDPSGPARTKACNHQTSDSAPAAGTGRRCTHAPVLCYRPTGPLSPPRLSKCPPPYLITSQPAQFYLFLICDFSTWMALATVVLSRFRVAAIAAMADGELRPLGGGSGLGGLARRGLGRSLSFGHFRLLAITFSCWTISYHSSAVGRRVGMAIMFSCPACAPLPSRRFFGRVPSTLQGACCKSRRLPQ